MKSTKDFRNPGHGSDSDDLMKKAVKLDPVKKSGKEKHVLYGDVDDDEGLDDYRKKESVLDYFDDGEDD